MKSQGEFDFGAAASDNGYEKWLKQRRVAAAELARRINLPINSQVEVWLVGGVRLRGLLRLKEEMLFLPEDHAHHLPLVVDGVEFSCSEIESCVRLD